MACSLENIITMQRGKHTRLILETMRVCRPPPATAGEYLHTLANTFFRYSKSFPHGAETHYQVCHNSPYLNLDELVENPVEDIQGNLVNLFELPVDDKDDKAKEVALQDIPQRKNKMLKWQYGVDCGIYALAFCFYIFSKRTNPINVFFNQRKLRSLFLHCITAKKITHFPMSQTATKTCVAKTVTIVFLQL